MSTNAYKTSLRISPEITDENNFKHFLDALNIEYSTYGTDNTIDEIQSDGFDILYGIDSGNIYLDYIISKNNYDDPFFSGSIDLHKIKEIKNYIIRKYGRQVKYKIVSYGWYTGTDEPEIWD